ncbi:MAG: MOSC domain-containing protein [Thermodesulfobacteriota bacterium]|jgi:MOSC domain-containing protein YiiM|nr:MAG: MOSC domain-containing protein [Thermodesulfobacteriota bacterium]
MKGKILAVCVSKEKGTQKKNVGSGELKAHHGIEGDAHAGAWHRQVSLLAHESIEKMKKLGLELDYGDFGENIVTQGIDLINLGVGSKLRLGDSVIGEITQIGKVCHDRCAIYYKTGDCIMPREGIFIKILTDGKVAVGDTIEVIRKIADNNQ